MTAADPAPAPQTDSAPPACPVRRRLREALGWLCWAACGLGVALHLTIRDDCPFPWYAAYYALPRPVLAALAALAWLAWRRSPRRRTLARLVTLGLLVWVGQADCRWGRSQPPAAGNELRIAFWNAAGRPRGWEPTTSEIARWGADVVGLVECGYARDADQQYWRSRFPEYAIDHPDTGLVFLVRGEIRDRGQFPLGVRSQARWYDVRVDAREFRVVLVDIVSSLGVPRRGPLERLTAELEKWTDRPVIVVGDFNTPVDSRWLDNLRTLGFREAFRTAGRGYAPTWPVPAPVLALDQIWGNGRVRFHAADRGWTQLSDHRPAFASATIVTTGSGG